MASSTPTKILHLIGDDGTLEPADNIAAFIQQELAVNGNNNKGGSTAASSKRETEGEAEEGAEAKPSRSSSNDSYELITAPDQVGLNYRVICVFGGQSSGKSTLLNRLFGTQFDTMDSARGRQQTTKGAFFSKAPVGNNNVFVTDFEGTDGVERGEDQSFERQLSLFALSCADTLIMNMWCHEVGRFNGANLALLRAVFEVNLQLFSHIAEDGVVDQRDKEKPTLLFVLRDWDGSQEQDALFQGVNRSLEVVWEKVTKPKAYQESALRDLFDIKYEALPHFNFQKVEFTQACEKLQANFINPKSPGYMYKTNETFRGVPLEALPQYLTSCWESIKESKDLNIPSQRQMLAQVRCREAAATTLASFKESVGNSFHDRIKKQERIPLLNKTLEDKMAELLLSYQNATKLYAGAAAAKHEEELKASLEKLCAKLVTFQCRQIAAEEMDQCESKVQKVLDVALKGLHAQSLKACAEEKELNDGATFNWTATNTQIITNFWTSIRRGIDELVGDVTKILAAKGEGKNSTVLNADPEGLSRVLLLLKDAADKKIQSRVEAMAADPHAAMTKQFEHALDQDPTTGSVRTFHGRSALEGAYKPAAHTGVLLLGCLFAARLGEPNEMDNGVFLSLSGPGNSDEPVYPSGALSRLATMMEAISSDDVQLDLCEAEDEEDMALTMTDKQRSIRVEKLQPTVAVILSKDAVSRAFEMYSKECTFTLKLRLQQIDSGSKVLPGWVYAALVFLGFNEAYYALTNPLVLIVLMVVGYFFLQTWAQEQWSILEEKAPGAALMIKTGWAVVEPHVEKVKAQLANLAGQPGQQETSAGASVTTPRGVATPRDIAKSDKAKKED